MPDREKYIEVLSKAVKEVKEFNEDAPIKISLECIEDILELLKEQEAVQWINVKDKLPEKDGQYLVVYAFFDCKSMGVVRCKDCKYAHKTYDGDCKYCDMFTDDDGNPIERYRSGDWFCADGKRKEGR